MKSKGSYIEPPKPCCSLTWRTSTSQQGTKEPHTVMTFQNVETTRRPSTGGGIGILLTGSGGHSGQSSGCGRGKGTGRWGHMGLRYSMKEVYSLTFWEIFGVQDLALHNMPRYSITDHKWKNRMKPQKTPPLPHTHIPAWHPTRKFLLGHVSSALTMHPGRRT